MPTIDRYVQLRSSFDPEIIEILGTAFQMACALVGHTPQPVAVREAIAKGILEAAKEGERDPQCLRDAGLATIDPQYRAEVGLPGKGSNSKSPTRR